MRPFFAAVISGVSPKTGSFCSIAGGLQEEAARGEQDCEVCGLHFAISLLWNIEQENFNNLTSLRPQRRLETSKESNTPRRGAAVQPERTAGTTGGGGGLTARRG